MDCRTARDILDVLRPGTDDRADAEVADAVAHLDDCDECTLAVRHREALDRQIGRTLRDVPVPAGVKQRLHQILRIDAPAGAASDNDARPEPIDSRGAPVTVAPGAVQPSRSPRRRHWTSLAAVAAAVVLLAVVWLLNRDPGPRATLAQLYENVPLDLSTAEPFDGNFDVALPAGGWTGSRVAVDRQPRGSNLGLGGEHVVALYGFRFRGRDRRPVEGLLVVAPAGSIDIRRPLSTAFGGAETEYPQALRTPDGQQLASRAWSSGDLVYICLVPADRTEELEQLLYLPLG